MPDRLPPRYDLGDFTLYAISDGLYRLDGGAMFGVVPKVLWEKVKPPDARNRIDMCLTCLLVVAGDTRILIEAGIGDKNPDKFNDIYGVDRITTIDEELGRLGLDASEIDHVVLTHLHFDHAGGLTVLNEKGVPIPHFPNARHHVHALEWEAATHPHARNRASYIPADWMPVYEAGLMDLCSPATHLPGSDDFEIIPGITCHHLGGHSEGLMMVRIESSKPVAAGVGANLVFARRSVRVAVFPGDLIPTGAHVPVPWIMGYDLDPRAMVEMKERFLSQWEEERALIVFVHETRYPWGFVKSEARPSGRAFSAEPLDKGWLEPLRRVKWPELP